MGIEQQLQLHPIFIQTFQHAPSGMILIDTNGQLVRANPTACSWFGYEEHELLRRSLTQMIDSQDICADHLYLFEALKLSNGAQRFRQRFLHQEGCVIEMEITASILHLTEEAPPLLLYQMIKQPEPAAPGKNLRLNALAPASRTEAPYIDQLEYNEQGYRSLFHHHPDLIYSMDLNGTYTSVNPSFECQMKYTQQEIVDGAINFRDLIVPAELETVEHHFLQASKGIAQKYEATAIRKSGQAVTFDVINIPIYVTDEIVGVYGIARDTACQKALINKLQKTEQLYQLISEHSQDVISLAAPDGRITYVSPAIKALLGYEPKEYIGQVATDFWHPEDWAAVNEQCLLQDASETLFMCRVRHKKGHFVWFETTATRIEDKNGDMISVLAVGRDITTRKQADQELKAAKDQLESFIYRNIDPIVIFDLNERVVKTNYAFEKTFGWKEEDLIGVWVMDLPNNPSDSEAEVLHNLNIIKSDEVFEGVEAIRVRRDGALLIVTLSSFAMYDEHGEISGWALIIRDMTEKKQSEEFIIQSEKLAIAGQLAAGIAHEIRNPITAIKGFIQLMKSGAREKAMYYDIMTSEIERIEVILSELLILAKPQIVHLVSSDIRVLISQVTTLLDTQAILNNVELITDLSEDIPPILCDENQIKQVFINFIKNAIEAMSHGGRILIQAVRTEHSIIVRFIDNGCGISEAVLSKLGQPFFTTKETGTGLGFMVSKRIIGNHRGTVEVYSVENEGTTIEVTLPIACSM